MTIMTEMYEASVPPLPPGFVPLEQVRAPVEGAEPEVDTLESESDEVDARNVEADGPESWPAQKELSPARRVGWYVTGRVFRWDKPAAPVVVLDEPEEEGQPAAPVRDGPLEGVYPESEGVVDGVAAQEGSGLTPETSTGTSEPAAVAAAVAGEAAAKAVVAPEVATPSRTLLQKLGRLATEIGAEVKYGWAKTAGYFGDAEKGEKRVAKVAGAVGAVAILAFAFWATRGQAMPYHMPIGTTGPVIPHRGSSPPPVIVPPPKPPPGTYHNYRMIYLKPGTGDSFWSMERLRHPFASLKEIHERVNRDLKLNGLSWPQARNISGRFKATK